MEKPIPYDGDKPFIFISYSHRDSDVVWPIISQMIKNGYRVWYDDGIDPGTEWDEFIATKISECGYFIGFISDNYIASDNCKDELNFARDQVENRLLVYIKDTPLPKGMEMRLGRIQAIHLYSFKSQNQFFSKLYMSKNLYSFRDAPVNINNNPVMPKMDDSVPTLDSVQPPVTINIPDPEPIIIEDNVIPSIPVASNESEVTKVSSEAEVVPSPEAEAPSEPASEVEVTINEEVPANKETAEEVVVAPVIEPVIAEEVTPVAPVVAPVAEEIIDNKKTDKKPKEPKKAKEPKQPKNPSETDGKTFTMPESKWAKWGIPGFRSKKPLNMVLGVIGLIGLIIALYFSLLAIYDGLDWYDVEEWSLGLIATIIIILDYLFISNYGYIQDRWLKLYKLNKISRILLVALIAAIVTVVIFFVGVIIMVIAGVV